MNTKVDIDNLIIENQRLIYKAIKDMHCVYKTEDEFQELYDAGLEGLIKGAKLYDESKGKPSTWLYPCIQNKIMQCFTIRSAKKRKNEFGRDVSLYEKAYNDEDSLEIIDTIEDSNINIEKDLEKKLEIEKLMYAVDNLKNEKDKLFLCEFYGLKGYERLSLQELQKKYGVSHSLVSFRLKRARETLRNFLESNDKEVFMLENKKVIEPVQTNVKAAKYKSLNDYLFEQIEKLNSADVNLEKEIPKAKVIAQLSQQIINNANTYIKAVRTVKEFEIDDIETLNLLGFENVKK